MHPFSSKAILFTLCFLQLEKAVEILDEMTLAGVRPNEHTYTNIMHGYASLGDTGKAFEYFTKLRNEGLELDVYTYEALLKACCKSGRMQSALAVTKEMSAQKIPKNTFVYNILIDGYELSITLEVQQYTHNFHFNLSFIGLNFSNLFFRIYVQLI